MSGKNKFSGDTISVKTLIDNYKELGIPHFQRGQIWKEENKSALLESLFNDTPCGSIILWRPANPKKPESEKKENFGEGLLNNKFDHLIIDGQQRITSLYEILNSPDKKYDANDEWCLNLVKFAKIWSNDPEIKKLNQDNLRFDEIIEIKPQPKMESQSFFKLIKYPPKKNNHPSKYRFLPIKYIFPKDNNEIDKEDIEDCLKIQDKTKLDPLLNIISKRIQKILDRKFFLKRLVNGSVRTNRIKHIDIINIYNSINSEGMIAKPEELALSHLVSIHQESSERIKRLYDKIHGESEKNQSKKRLKENQFGFKLFIRTFILVCNYHFNHIIKSKDLSLDVLEKNETIREHIKKDVRVGEFLWNTTELILDKFKNDILVKELKCDDLRFLPETNSLLPVFMMMLRYEKIIFKVESFKTNKVESFKTRVIEIEDREIEDSFIKPLAKLTLGLLLNDKRDIYKILEDIRLSTKTVDEMFKELFNDEDKAKFPDDFTTKLEEEEIEKSSIQSNYLKLLYWLERKKCAKDFSYELNAPILKTKEREEKKINKDCDPEKQHIVPFSILKDGPYPKAKRTGSHLPNNIGNMTFISQSLNSIPEMDGGVGDTPLELLKENMNNLEAHFFNKEVVRQYEDIKYNPNASGFEKFIRKRRELISKGFEDWYEKLGNIDTPHSKKLINQITLPLYGNYDRYNLFDLLISFENDLENILRNIINRGDFNFETKKSTKSGIHNNISYLRYRYKNDDNILDIQCHAPDSLKTLNHITFSKKIDRLEVHTSNPNDIISIKKSEILDKDKIIKLKQIGDDYGNGW